MGWSQTGQILIFPERMHTFREKWINKLMRQTANRETHTGKWPLNQCRVCVNDVL